MQFSTAHDRAENNGWSTDNVRPDRELDQSNSGFCWSFLDTNILFSIQLLLNPLTPEFFCHIASVLTYIH